MPLTDKSQLTQFRGTENYYRHGSGRILLTDGIKFLAEEAEAYWLIDAIASYQTPECLLSDPMLQDYQFWHLQVNEDESAQLTCERDTGDVVLTQSYRYTDFYLRGITLYLVQRVLMLPSEY